VRERHRSGYGDAGGRDERGRDRLVERLPARRGPRPHERQPERHEHVADRTVLARGTVQQRYDAGGVIAREAGQQVRVDVEHIAVDTGHAQGVGDAATRADRHVAFGREPSRENDHAALRCSAHAS
jgi:hypothetical protein